MFAVQYSHDRTSAILTFGSFPNDLEEADFDWIYNKKDTWSLDISGFYINGQSVIEAKYEGILDSLTSDIILPFDLFGKVIGILTKDCILGKMFEVEEMKCCYCNKIEDFPALIFNIGEVDVVV